MPIAALSGPQYLREGLKLILSPGLRLFVILPLTVNLLLFGGLIYLALRQFDGWVDAFMPSLPDWLAFLQYILWPLFVVLVVLIVFFTFTLLANIIAAPLWLLFGIWMMAVQYIDYPADNNRMSWAEMMVWLRQRRWKSLSFGAVTYAALLVPGLNLLIMPAAVAGATLFWVREGGQPQLPAERA